jgi:hypothetical protein
MMKVAPAEVLDIIFRDLVPREGGYYDLWQASLVCHAWRHPAQRRAFRAIRVLRVLNLKERLALIELVTRNAMIGSYIVYVSIKFDLGEQKEKEVDERVGTLFPNVTHLEFSSSKCQTSLDLASRFRRSASLVTLRNGKDLHNDSLSPNGPDKYHMSAVGFSLPAGLARPCGIGSAA